MYKITRYKKDRSESRVLSKNMDKWLKFNSKRHYCLMTEEEANKYIKENEINNLYYFFKTIC